jgi:hypothetical protein
MDAINLSRALTSRFPGFGPKNQNQNKNPKKPRQFSRFIHLLPFPPPIDEIGILFLDGELFLY